MAKKLWSNQRVRKASQPVSNFLPNQPAYDFVVILAMRNEYEAKLAELRQIIETLRLDAASGACVED